MPNYKIYIGEVKSIVDISKNKWQKESIGTIYVDSRSKSVIEKKARELLDIPSNCAIKYQKTI